MFKNLWKKMPITRSHQRGGDYASRPICKKYNKEHGILHIIKMNLNVK